MPAQVTARSSAGRRGSRRLGTRARFVLLVATAVFAFLAIRGLPLRRSWQALQACDPLWLAGGLLVLALAMLARAARWRSLFAPGRRPGFGAVANAMMVGYLYNNILPARSGEVARVVVLNRRSSAQGAEIAGTALLERVYDLLGVLVIFFLALPWLPAVGWVTAASIAAGVLALGILLCALALAIYGERAPRAALAPLRRLARVEEQTVERLAQGLAHGLSGLRRPGVAAAGFAWTITGWMLTALLAYLVGVAFHLHLPFASGVLVAVAVGLAMVIPAPPAAIGVFEGAALLGMRAYGLSYASALPYALVLHLVNFLPFIVVGVALLHFNSRPSASESELAHSQLEVGGESGHAHSQLGVERESELAHSQLEVGGESGHAHSQLGVERESEHAHPRLAVGSANAS